jgi:gluconate 2-dehydrogenase gamma chain
MTDVCSRRTFLRAAIAAGAAWTAADLVQVEEALAWAAHQQTTRAQPAFSVLTPDQAAALDAMTSRIIPSVDGRPGAHEAGVVHFIDKSLATFNAARKPLYVDGVLDLNQRAAQRRDGVTFAAMTATEQDDLLHELEKTPFFETVRFDTIVGTFAVPAWGGNRNYAGWHLLGLDHRPQFQPPFGYYDAEANRSS